MFGQNGDWVSGGALLLAALAAIVAMVLAKAGTAKLQPVAVVLGVLAVLLCGLAGTDQYARDSRNTYRVVETAGDDNELRFTVEFERQPGGFAIVRARNEVLKDLYATYGFRPGYHQARQDGNVYTYRVKRTYASGDLPLE